MNRKHLIGLSFVSAVFLAGCSYSPTVTGGGGNPVPDPAPVISEPLNLPQTNFDRRSPEPLKCKQDGLLGQYWRSGNSTLGLQSTKNVKDTLSSVSVVAGTCYDIVRISNNTYTYPGINVRYVDENLLEVSVNVSDEYLTNYSYVTDESFNAVDSLVRVPGNGNLVLQLKLKSPSLYAVEYDTSNMYRTEIRLFVAPRG